MATDNYKSLDFYKSNIGKIQDGFSKFSKGDHHYFTYNKNGRIYLISEDYTTEKGRDNGIESVKKNMKDKSRFINKSNNKGQHFFSLRAGNNQEIARSTYFGSAADLGSAVTGLTTGKWLSGAAAAGAAGLAASTKKVKKTTQNVEKKVERKVEKKVEHKKEKVVASSSYAASSSTKKVAGETVRKSGGFNWLWLLPLLLIPLLFFLIRGCGGCGDAGAIAGDLKEKTTTAASNVVDKVEDTATLAAEKAAEAARKAEEEASKLAAETKRKAEEAARAAKEEAARQANYYKGNKSSGY